MSSEEPAAILRVTGPEEDPLLERQLGELALHARGIRRRGVRVAVEPGDVFGIALLGPDGSERATWREPVAATEVWERLGRSASTRHG